MSVIILRRSRQTIYGIQDILYEARIISFSLSSRLHRQVSVWIYFFHKHTCVYFCRVYTHARVFSGLLNVINLNLNSLRVTSRFWSWWSVIFTMDISFFGFKILFGGILELFVSTSILVITIFHIYNKITMYKLFF